MTEPDGLPLNHPDTVSPFRVTTTMRLWSFASVRIFPGVKWSASPNFSSPKKRKNGTHLLIGPWADKTGQAFNTGRVAENNNTECRI
jgi:hypothetical protein